eukprot:scaffold6048_cov401-Pinguiococcus_pyrenoidosus.AAC.1
MDKDVRRHLQACAVCRAAKAYNRRNLGLYQLTNYDGTLQHDGDIVAYDHIITSGKGVRGIATLVDICSGYTVIYAIENQEHHHLLEQFERYYVSIYGVPLVMVADSEISSTLWNEFARMLRVKLRIATPHHAQGNAMAERGNRSVQEILRAFLIEAGGLENRDHPSEDRWARYLPYVQSALNSRRIANTNFTPYEAKFGRPYRSPLDMLLIQQGERATSVQPETSESMRQRIRIIRKIRGLVHTSRVERRAAVLLRLNADRKEAPLQPGDIVMRYLKSRTHKLVPRTVG